MSSASSVRPFRDLPNELWLFILDEAVQSSDWTEHSFFPPGVDLTVIQGLKNTCRRFRDLIEQIEYRMRNRLILVHDIRDVRKLSLQAKDLKHLKVQGDAAVVDSWTFTGALRPYSNLESLSIIFKSNTDVLSSYLSLLPLHQSLRRLHLTSINTDLCHLPLDFPNLVDLQLSRAGPGERAPLDTTYMLETSTSSVSGLNFASLLLWFTEGLRKSVIKLQRLRFLSVDVSLATIGQYMSVRALHTNTHSPDRCNGEGCKVLRGLQVYESQKIVRRESSTSERLAEFLPELERVRWIDIWKTGCLDEGRQREYRISRSDGGIILAFLNLKLSPIEYAL